MDGTTLCPHGETRFKVGITQLEAHQGMVRCGQCMQVFDARPNFIPDHPSPQLELVMPEVDVVPINITPVDAVTDPVMVEEASAAIAEEQVREPDFTNVAAESLVVDATESRDDHLDFLIPITALSEERIHQRVAHDDDDTLDEHHNEAEEEENVALHKPRTWLWVALIVSLLLLLFAQAAYFFRADIAARQPGLRGALAQYCELLGCKVGLPRSYTLMSIESSTLEADPNNSSHITLNALLRNRAGYPLAYPDLELTLNDRQDKPVARRSFKPADYLPPLESEQAGLQANHELSIKLFMDTNDLNPNGYRLVLTYPAAP
jgi:predicted Zn finger-like uncharacterized protein